MPASDAARFVSKITGYYMSPILERLGRATAQGLGQDFLSVLAGRSLALSTDTVPRHPEQVARTISTKLPLLEVWRSE